MDQSTSFVYGSRCRPISGTWAKIPDAEYQQSNASETGYHTLVVVPERLSRDVVNAYELVLVSRPPIKREVR
jgi:hypothetical protein